MMKKIDDVLRIQEKYECGELKLSEMTDIEYRNLEKIYNVQIYQLDNEINQYKNKIEKSRQDILKYRNSTIN